MWSDQGPLRAYAGAVTLAGWCALLVGAAAWLDQPTSLDHAWLPVFALAVILGECFPVRLWRADGEVTVSIGFTLALLWMAGPAPVLLIQAAAVLAAEIVSRRRKLRRMLFNVGQLSLSWLAAAGAIELMGGAGGALAGDTGRAAEAIAAMVVAGAVFSAVNLTLTAGAAALASGSALRAVMAGYGRIEAVTVVMLTGFAPVIVVTLQEAPLLMPLLAFPLAAIHVGGKALARSEREALHDGLTGLANRTQLREALAQRPAAGPVAVLFCDLDRFKDVNDSLGHAVGDQLLRHVAAEMRARLPADVLIARMAGDEFAVMAPGAGAPRARELARAVHALLHAVPEVHGVRLAVGASIGIALAPDHGVDPDVLFKRAEIAMYDAKQRRNDTAVYRVGTDEAAADRMHLTRDLREAIRARDIDVHYQPKLDLATGGVCGVEALARWTHPKRGPVSPAVFVPLAETGGLIGELGSVVLERAVAQVARWRDFGLDLHVAVNLSVRRLLDEGVVEEVAAVLARHGVPGAALELEITESVFLDDPERAQAVLGDLAALGVSLAVDDYGTGYSALSYLRDLPVSALKIDRSFVRDIVASPTDQAIVASTLVLARSLGLRVVAEGIEDDAALAAVTRLGCHQAQGFHIGRPQPGEVLTRWLLRDRAPSVAA